MTPWQRTELVLQILRLVRRAGVSEQTPYCWYDFFISVGQGALNVKDPESGLQAEMKCKETQLAERDKLIGELTVTNRI